MSLVLVTIVGVGKHVKTGIKNGLTTNDVNGRYKVSRPQKWSCWFCLGNDKVEKQLVASRGPLCYVAVAKGGLVPGHVIICQLHTMHQMPHVKKSNIFK